MKIKTKDLIGDALDYAVFLAALNSVLAIPVYLRTYPDRPHVPHWNYGGGSERFQPSLRGEQAVPILDQAHIGFEWLVSEWKAAQNYAGPAYRDAPQCCPIGTRYISYGPTGLIAGMRCFVLSELGEEVPLPDHLMEN